MSNEKAIAVGPVTFQFSTMIIRMERQQLLINIRDNTALNFEVQPMVSADERPW